MTLDHLLVNLAYKSDGCFLSFQLWVHFDNKHLVVFCDSLYVLRISWISWWLSKYTFQVIYFPFIVHAQMLVVQCPGQSPYTSAETLWFWECKSVGKFSCHSGYWWLCLVYLLCVYPFCILSGERRTQCFLHLFKILSCSRAHIWCHWVHNCNRYMVYRLCDGWVTSWTGGLILEIIQILGPAFTVLYILSLTFLIPLIFQPLFPGESGVDQLVEIIKVRLLYYCPPVFVNILFTIHIWNSDFGLSSLKFPTL